MAATGLVFWAFIALVQGVGAIGGSAGTQADCEVSRLEVAADEATLAVEAACREVVLKLTAQNGA